MQKQISFSSVVVVVVVVLLLFGILINSLEDFAQVCYKTHEQVAL